MAKKIQLSNREKILLVLFKLSSEAKKNIRFEDAVVALFKKFPKDFHLRGYEEYPDAEAIRKPLYEFKRLGVLLVRNMVISFTYKGLDMAKKIKEKSSRKTIIQNDGNKFDRYIEKEIYRIQKLNSYNKYLRNDKEIFDTDFFDYLGVSVKSDRNEFKSRLRTVADVAKSLKSESNQALKNVTEFHQFMIAKFKDIVNYKLKN